MLAPVLGSMVRYARQPTLRLCWLPLTAYYAAGYKHVLLVEDNVAEGVMRDVLDTRNLARAATASGVEALVLISTDKALRQTSMLDTGKHVAKLILQEPAASPAVTARDGAANR